MYKTLKSGLKSKKVLEPTAGLTLKRVWAAGLLLAVTQAVLAAPWDTKFFNPKPAEDDVILPMPCEGSMAFRKIHVPLDKPLDDLKVMLGSDSGDLR
jgi:hypothetical protein